MLRCCTGSPPPPPPPQPSSFVMRMDAPTVCYDGVKRAQVQFLGRRPQELPSSGVADQPKLKAAFPIRPLSQTPRTSLTTTNTSEGRWSYSERPHVRNVPDDTIHQRCSIKNKKSVSDAFFFILSVSLCIGFQVSLTRPVYLAINPQPRSQDRYMSKTVS